MHILQYNVQKSWDVGLASLFRDPRIADCDIIAIQEPWRNPFIATSYHPLKATFNLAYPDNEETRVCFYVNQRIDPSTWTISRSAKDMIILEIDHTALGGRLHIINVHNEVVTDALSDLREVLSEIDPRDEVLLLGDFNLHHPLWTIAPHLAARGATAAQPLVAIMQDFQLHLLTTPGAPTHRWIDGESTIDLPFATEGLESCMLYCKVEHSRDCDSDHLPVS